MDNEWGLTPKKTFPTLVMLIAVYLVAVLFSIESIVVSVTVFLAGWAAIFSTVYLREVLRKRNRKLPGLVLFFIFVLAAVVFFLLLKWIADLSF